MIKSKILCIVPYNGIKTLIQNLQEEYETLEIETYVADMERAVALANTLLLEDYTAIISRAGSVDLLSQVSPVPVLDIGITIYDMLRAVRTAQGYGGRFAVVGFAPITEYATILNDLLAYELDVVTIQSMDTIPTQLEQLKAQGYELIVGDAITCRYSKKAGLNTNLIQSDTTSVRKVLDECVRWQKAPSFVKFGSGMFGSGMIDRSNKIPAVMLETFVSSSIEFMTAMQNMKDYAGTHLSVMLYGPIGTGKDSFAQGIYTMSEQYKKSFITIDCRKYYKKDWQMLMSEKSLLLDKGNTIYFKHIHRLSERDKKELVEFLENTMIYKSNRLIFSSEQEEIAIKMTVDAVSIKIPGLSNRRDDIPKLAQIYMSEMNVDLNKNIVGIEPGAKALLQSYGWHHNITQLKWIMRELVATCKHMYIDEALVQRVLEKEVNLSNKQYSVQEMDQGTVMIKVEGTLEQMIDQIVEVVLHQENMNQSKTSKRLGIGRSTLWRKIKYDTPK